MNRSVACILCLCVAVMLASCNINRPVLPNSLPTATPLTTPIYNAPRAVTTQAPITITQVTLTHPPTATYRPALAVIHPATPLPTATYRPTLAVIYTAIPLPTATPTNVPQTTLADNIQEAVFRYQLHYGSTLQEKVWCLSVGGHDPSAELLERFQNSPLPVKKASQCVHNPGDVVKDKETGEPGVILLIDNIRWLNNTLVQVDGRYYKNDYEGNLGQSGCSYQVELVNNQWSVSEGYCAPK